MGQREPIQGRAVHSWDRCRLARDPLVEAIRATIGVPFKPHGRDPEKGLDCVGVLLVPLLAAGIDVPEEHRARDYPPGGDAKRLRGFLGWYGEETRLEQAESRQSEPFAFEPLDVVLFGILGIEAHLGVMVSQSRIVHAWYPNRKVIEHDLRGVWLRRARSVFRCKYSLD